MALQIESVINTCRLITHEIKDYQKNLLVYFIVHHEGQQTEALGLAAQNIQSHPASKTAMRFLQKQRQSENSELLGIAVARQNLFFGLATRETGLALCTVNISQFTTLKEAHHYAYHLIWHALDSVQYHGAPNNRTGKATEIILRKRNALEMISANLQADVFSAALSVIHGDKEAMRHIAIKRGRDVLQANRLHSPEFYPFVIAMESAEFALGQIDQKKISKKKRVPTALRIARDVGKAYDETTLKYWLAFAKPAQEMAWQGYSEENILAAAINTSPNTYVRTNGHMVSELTTIKPTSILDINKNYSAYTDDEFNKNIHDKLINDTYQDVIAQGLQQNSGLPFLNMANQQNQALTEGEALGWCASALHAAGTAYESAKENDSTPERLAHKKFKTEKDKTKWKNLKQLGSAVVHSRREGSRIMLDDLKKMTERMKGLKHLKNSIEKTIATANELSPELPGLKPAGKAPAIIPKIIPKVPLPERLTIPGLGGVSKNILQYGKMEEEKDKEND